MKISSQTEEKNPRKYYRIDRALQAQILDESSSQSQRQLAKKYNIPNTTLQHWIERKKELKGKTDPNVVNSFESSSGQAWLHNMVIATFMIFHQNGNSGIPDLHEYFDMTAVNKFVGTSISALQKIGKILDKQTIVFGQEESARLAKNMPHKNIPGALDENFIMDEMTLILMDPVAGFILAEQIEEKRDVETWFKVNQAVLKGLNVTIQQLVGDEAGGLTKLATRVLKVIKGPDFFTSNKILLNDLQAIWQELFNKLKKNKKTCKKRS